MFKLKVLHAVATMLGIQMTYYVRFLPVNGKRADLRGRRVGDPITDPNEAIGFFQATRTNPKEKTDGAYLFTAEASLGGFMHKSLNLHTDAPTVPTDGPGPLYAGLPETAQGGPTATAAPEAAYAEAERAARAGTDGGQLARAQAAAEPSQPMGTVSAEPGMAERPSLADLGRR